MFGYWAAEILVSSSRIAVPFLIKRYLKIGGRQDHNSELKDEKDISSSQIPGTLPRLRQSEATIYTTETIMHWLKDI